MKRRAIFYGVSKSLNANKQATMATSTTNALLCWRAAPHALNELRHQYNGLSVINGMKKLQTTFRNEEESLQFDNILILSMIYLIWHFHCQVSLCPSIYSRAVELWIIDNESFKHSLYPTIEATLSIVFWGKHHQIMTMTCYKLTLIVNYVCH